MRLQRRGPPQARSRDRGGPAVKAIFVMAPALATSSTRPAWPKSTCRCGSIGRRRMRSSPILDAERIAQMLPKPPEYQLIEGAGHYIFLPPCPPAACLAHPRDLQRPKGSTAPHSRAPQRRDDRLLRARCRATTPPLAALPGSTWLAEPLRMADSTFSAKCVVLAGTEARKRAAVRPRSAPPPRSPPVRSATLA